jgi:streptogramin lyase
MDYANGVLYRFGSLGGVASATTQVNATPIGGAPTGLAFGKDGHLYLARQSASDVLEINPTTGSIVRTVASGVPCATGIATDPLSGDLFVSTVGCSSIGVMRLSSFASGPATITGYASPGTTDGVTFAPDGALYAAVFGQSIVRIAGTNAPTPGGVTTLANVPSSDGTAVAASSDPSRPPFIFANRNDRIISRIDLTTTPPTLSTVANAGTRGDFVAVGPDGCLYAT